MCQLFVVLLFVLANTVCVMCSDLFHVNSRTMFRPDEAAEYFGYAVSLSDMGLHIGAPKAKSRIVKGSSPGMVFVCPVAEYNSSDATCLPLREEDRDNRYMRRHIQKDFFKHDMWFGAVVTVVPEGKLLVCAPRVTTPYQDKHLLANGICYLHSKNKEQGLYPLRDPKRQAFLTDGHRPEYGESGAHLHYFAFGQSGMSVAVTKNNRLLIGAPGVLYWTGAVVDYKFDPSPSLSSFTFISTPVTNPYYTKDLGPDDYFGYSVDSGTFDESGVVLYVAGAPRSSKGYGQVLLFQSTGEMKPLNIRAKIEGPQLGSYFGASICAVDIDGDGLSDLLVGAPNYAKRQSGVLHYDQGAVYVYMSRKEDYRFVLKETGHVIGSGESGARFGSAIADLGDVDGDGHNEIAVGAPWENDGSGAVYIYKGSEHGLHSQYIQKLYADGARSFGIAVSKGYDVDKNNCNDVAIGALNSGSAYLYRSVPTIQVLTLIKVPDAKNMKQNATNFNALLCVTVPMSKSLSNVEMDMKATISVDPEGGRAYTLGSTNFVVKVKPGLDICDEQIIAVNNQSDLSKPILIKFDLEPIVDLDQSKTLPLNMARISEDSTLQSSFFIQMLSDCGEDLVCTPWLEMTMGSLEGPYTPGIESQLGAKITVVNKEEPAYGVKLHVSLPCQPKRLPSSCSLQNLDMTCDLPAPLKRNQSAEWIVELEYTWEGSDSELNVRAALVDPLYMRNISEDAKEVVIPITPMSNYSFTGKPQPTQITNVTRDTFNKNGDVMFTHNYEVTNRGPSDYYHMEAIAYLPEDAVLAFPVEGTTLIDNKLTYKVATLKANTTATFELTLRYDLSRFGEKLNEQLVLNVTTTVYLYLQHYHGSTPTNASVAVTTTLVLEPTAPIWPHIVGSVAGLILLAAIILALYKFGFFSREKKEELKQLLENTSSAQEDPSPSSNQSAADGSNSTRELLNSDSE